MALHKDFPESPYAILDPAIRWFPADEALRESSSEKLMPPLVPQLRRKVKAFIQDRLFDRPVDLESPNTLRNLSELAATKTLLETFKKAINALTVQDKGDAKNYLAVHFKLD